MSRDGNKRRLAALAEIRYRRAMAEFEDAVMTTAEESLFATSKTIIELAKGYVPVDTGYLKGSHFVQKPKQTPRGLEARFGARAPYATAVHVRKPWLEQAIIEGSGNFESELRTRRQVIGRLRPARIKI